MGPSPGLMLPNIDWPALKDVSFNKLATRCPWNNNIINQEHDVVTQPTPLLWRHNEHDSVSNHQPHDCLLNHLFRRRSKKTSKPRVTGLCVGNSPGTGEFPAQKAIRRIMFPFDDVIMSNRIPRFPAPNNHEGRKQEYVWEIGISDKPNEYANRVSFQDAVLPV